jgi:hypothetical protein
MVDALYGHFAEMYSGVILQMQSSLLTSESVLLDRICCIIFLVNSSATRSLSSMGMPVFFVKYVIIAVAYVV